MSQLISLNLHTPVEKRSGPDTSTSLASMWAWINGGSETDSGEVVNDHTALQIITVYSCIRLISSTIASLPLKLYRNDGKSREEAFDHPLHDLLAVEPNPEMSSFNFFQTLLGCLALTGNSYALLQRVNGQVVALWPLHPHKTKPIRLPTGEIAYQTTDGMGGTESKIYPASDILHFRTFCLDGLLGLSPIQQARNSLGLTRAAEKMGSKLFKNAGRPSGVMTTDQILDETTLVNLREAWQNSQTGENSGKTAFLPGGFKYTALSLDLDSVQFLATRSFQRAEICSMYSVPVHLCGSEVRQSNTNHEQESLDLISFCLAPYLVNVENEIQRKLFPLSAKSKEKFSLSFDLRSLLRSDIKSQMEALNIGRNAGIYSANQVLHQLGENPIGPVGDVFLSALNYQNAENLLIKPTPEAVAKPEPTPNAADEFKSFQRLFRDSVGRLAARENKTPETLATIFEPLFRSICDVAEGRSARQFRLVDGWCQTQDRIVKEALKSLEKRCNTWTPENASEVTGQEFQKALRSIILNVSREAGAVMAELPNVSEQ